MDNASSEMINTLFSGMKQMLVALHNRIEALEKSDTERANFDFEQFVKESDPFETRVREIVEDKLDDFDPTDYYKFDDRVRDVVSDLDLVDKDDMTEVVRELLSDATVSISI